MSALRLSDIETGHPDVDAVSLIKHLDEKTIRTCGRVDVGREVLGSGWYRATIAPAQIAQYLKGDSSKWIHEEFRSLRSFGWQDGYGGFTVSKSNIPDVITYIQNQREHHRRRTFQEEYLDFLMKNGIEYDERYLW